MSTDGNDPQEEKPAYVKKPFGIVAIYIFSSWLALIFVVTLGFGFPVLLKVAEPIVCSSGNLTFDSFHATTGNASYVRPGEYYIHKYAFCIKGTVHSKDIMGRVVTVSILFYAALLTAYIMLRRKWKKFRDRPER